MAKKAIYIVIRGKKPGLYTAWFGPEGAAEQVQGYAGALYKAFSTKEEAQVWLDQVGQPDFLKEQMRPHRPDKRSPPRPAPENPKNNLTEVTLYTDGAALKNPGPGGYGVVLIHNQTEKELSAGYRLTTNNRMELLACIQGLKALKFRCRVTLFSDSKYVVNGIEKGWAKRWKKKGWMRDDLHPAKNSDLWQELLALCQKHTVSFRWVRGHAGHTHNERCDQLATRAASGKKLLTDCVYESQPDPE